MDLLKSHSRSGTLLLEFLRQPVGYEGVRILENTIPTIDMLFTETRFKGSDGLRKQIVMTVITHDQEIEYIYCKDDGMEAYNGRLNIGVAIDDNDSNPNRVKMAFNNPGGEYFIARAYFGGDGNFRQFNMRNIEDRVTNASFTPGPG